MKKTLFALSLLMTSNAFAEAIPQPILEVINVYQHGSFGLDKGVLSMAVKKPSVNEDNANFSD